jgi:hypothetical protein
VPIDFSTSTVKSCSVPGSGRPVGRRFSAPFAYQGQKTDWSRQNMKAHRRCVPW